MTNVNTNQLYWYCIDLCRSDDDYDEAIGTLLSIGASVLRVLGEKILEYYNSSQESLVSKIGESAPTTEILDLNIASGQQDSEEEVQRKKQVAEFVSSLSPEQLALHQKRVQEYFTDRND